VQTDQVTAHLIALGAMVCELLANVTAAFKSLELGLSSQVVRCVMWLLSFSTQHPLLSSALKATSFSCYHRAQAYIPFWTPC
jgi:hypothetical protein